MVAMEDGLRLKQLKFCMFLSIYSILFFEFAIAITAYFL